MAARHWLTMVVALSASLAVAGAEAAAKKKGDPMVARGCTHPVAPLCLGLTTPGGRTYALLDPSPWIPLHIGVRVYGKVTSASPCGTAIQVSSWQADKTIKCSKR